MIRASARGRLLALANFSEAPQAVPRHRLHDMGFTGELADRLEGRPVDSWSDLRMEPYQVLWLEQLVSQ